MPEALGSGQALSQSSQAMGWGRPRLSLEGWIDGLCPDWVGACGALPAEGAA